MSEPASPYETTSETTSVTTSTSAGGSPVTTRVPQVALALRGLTKRFGQTTAVDRLDLDVPRGSFYGLVGPNGAGKTTTLSMATGLLRPDAGTAHVLGVDVWDDPVAAKSQIGILPDGLRLFDRLTGQQLVTYAGLLRGMDRQLVAERTGELLAALGLAEARDKLVIDYSAGMTKKITLACALIHAPRLLVLDEPFEAVDPVSARTIRGILEDFAATGGTVVLSSHVMDLVERICTDVAIIAAGVVRASGTLDDVRAGSSLEDRFLDLVGGTTTVEGLAWLRTSSD
jgi:ABC-2 type transport system ATP-binding protein